MEIKPDVQMLARNRVAITIDIKEGETTKIKTLDFEGNEKFTDRRLRRVIGLTNGTLFSWLSKSNVFSWEKFARDKARLETFYHERGYFDFRLDEEGFRRQLSEDKTRENITIKVYEGERYYWGNVGLSGDLKDVPAASVQRHLSAIRTGKLSNLDKLNEVLAKVRL